MREELENLVNNIYILYRNEGGIGELGQKYIYIIQK
jgi:hypothetical protein